MALTAWERVLISRHPQRPLGLDYILAFSPDFHEIAGDRLFGDDPAMITGFGHIGSHRFAIIAQHKGKDSEKAHRNFGMPHPEGYRKALRCMQLAERFGIPIVCFIDTPGAFAGLGAEERGQGWAIAENMQAMASIKVPITIIITGEGCSGGALGIGVGDRIAMLEHAYYTVISPESCASILWKDSRLASQAAECLKLNAEFLLEHKIIDQIIKEPEGGAHIDKERVFQDIRSFILKSLNELVYHDPGELLKARYDRFRSIGHFRQA